MRADFTEEETRHLDEIGHPGALDLEAVEAALQ